MRILVSSPVFYPQVGGIEAVTRVLVVQFSRFGNEVRLLTDTSEQGEDQFPFPVYRRPTLQVIAACLQWCDVYFQSQVSLRFSLPLLAVARPLVTATHVWLRQADGRVTWREALKRIVVSRSRSIAVSNAVGEHLSCNSTIIGNPYDIEIFSPGESAEHRRGLVFLGRLVSDKGLDVLLHSIADLDRRGLNTTLTIIGDGPERARLVDLCRRLCISESVHFSGLLRGRELADTLRRHLIMVIPSQWDEPFGLVALEGIACGCVVVGSDRGGLKDAIGPCGLLFESGNKNHLAAILYDVLMDPSRVRDLRRCASDHLERFEPEKVARAYLSVLESAAENAAVEV